VSSGAAASLPPAASVERAGDSVPELWTPRTASVVDTSPPLDAASLFDGDATTGFSVEPGKGAAVRLELGSAQEVTGLGVHGTGRAKVAIYAEKDGARELIATGRSAPINLESDHWVEVVPTNPTKTSALVVQWTAASGSPVTVTELALWVAGRSRQALAEGAIADRLVTELPENAVATTAAPATASVARVTEQGPVSASFTLTLNREPRLGRAFLLYELEKKAHWTGAARSINGHVVRGGYRADVKGLGGLQVEEIDPAWLRSGSNTISFQPTLVEDGLGYTVHNVRVVSVPRGIESAPKPGAGTPLSDGDLLTGVGGPGVHAASLSVSSDREPAFMSFYLDKPTGGTLTVSTADRGAHRKGQVTVDLDKRPVGWQTVPVGGVLPANSALRVRVVGDREGKGQVSELRMHWFPSLTSPADLTISYPLHGECHDHKTYVRGFAAGLAPGQHAQLLVDGQPRSGQIDADGSFEADVPEPATNRGKPWSVRLDVATAGGEHRTRTVPIDTCVEPPKGRVLGVSPPVEDVGAPYGAVVSPQKASVLSFAGAKIEIPAGAVDSDVRVTMRALDRGQLPPLQAEMENVSTGGGAMRFGPHGLQFRKPVKVTLPIDSGRFSPGMNAADVLGFFFDETSSKWTQLPRVSGHSDHLVAETPHFTDFIAATVRTPDHPDAQQFNPNTMKNVKVGEPGAGITMIQPPEANANGSARLSYPIETPPARNGIGPQLALTYDSDRANSNGWLGLGWDISLQCIEIDTRFGVPKYDGSETYTLSGAALVPTTPAGTYIRRVEGPFDLIQRQGTGPSTYSWTVTDKNGTVFTYGTGANSRLANLRTGQTANIFRWYLERVQDTYGNFMTITYQHDTFSTTTTPSETFDEVYPSAIDYTAGPSLAANYHVAFHLDAVGTRPDTMINARPGFLVSTRRRLADITVTSGTSLVRQYKFFYEQSQQDLTDRMQKSLLSAVALWGTQDVASSELYRHTFQYNKAPAVSAMFGGPQPWGQVSQATSGGGTVPRTDNGLAHSSDVMAGGAVTLGVGFPEFSATGSFGMDTGSSTPDLAFLGLTGEGLPDQVDTAGMLSQNSLIGKAPTDPAHFLVSSVNGLTGLGATDRSGWTASGNVSALSGFGVGASYGRHLSNDRSLISDINGDGFPDIVWANGSQLNAYINDGERDFSPQTWTGYDLSNGNAPFSTANRVTAAGTANAYFNTDPLTRWVAPFGGTVTINAAATRDTPAGDSLTAELYVVNDTVRTFTIAPSDSGTHALATNLSHAVSAGDRIYLRVKPLGTSPRQDGAMLSLSVVYTPPMGRNVSELEPDGSPIFKFDASTDFRVTGAPRANWHLAGNGDLAVARCFLKTPSSDDLKVSYVLRDKTGKTVTGFPKSLTLPAAAPAAGTTICFSNTVLPPLPSDSTLGSIPNVVADETIAFEVTSDSPVDPTAIGVNSDSASSDGKYLMTYTRFCRNTVSGGSVNGTACGTPQVNTNNGTYTIAGDPFPEFPIPASDIEHGLFHTSEEVPGYFQTYVWRVFNNGTTTVQQPMRSAPAPSTSVTFSGTVTTSGALTEPAVLLIQGVKKLHKKFPLAQGSNGTFTVPTVTITGLQVNEPVFFTIYSPTIGGNTKMTWTPRMNNVAVSALNINRAIQDSTYDNNPPVGNVSHDPMSDGFHHWFYGDWNDSIAFADSLIMRSPNQPTNADPVMAVIPVTTEDSAEYDGRGGVNITGDSGIGGTFDASPGEVNTPSATATSADGMSALRIADSWNVDVTASIPPMVAGVNGGDGTTQVDFFDFNGDHYPDSITLAGVQYNDGVSGFAPRQAVDMRTEVGTSNEANEIRKILNVSLQAGVAVGGGSNRELVTEAKGNGETKKLSATVSLSGSADYGVSSTRIDFVDVNGDGLLDHVREDPDDGMLRVRLNLGYGFSNEVEWPAPGWTQDHTLVGWPSIPGASGTDPVGAVLNQVPGKPNNTNVIRVEDTGTLSVTVGANVGDVIGGGGGPTWSVTRKWVDLIDVNGDGLPDQVLKVPGTADPNLHVKLNTGTGFGAEQLWALPPWPAPTNFDSTFSFLPLDGLGFSAINGWGKNLSVQVCFFICFGMSGYESDSLGGSSADFEDIDGDGKLDQVLKLPGDANVYAKINNIGQTNLLSAVNRPLGSSFTISYARAGNHVMLPVLNMPSNQWVMSSVVLNSGAGQSYNAVTTENFDYTTPKWGVPAGIYDPVERENYGYANVKTFFPAEDQGTSIVSTYFQDYYEHGLESSKFWYQNDSAQTILRGQGEFYQDPTPGKDPTTVPARTGTLFPALREFDHYYYEAGSTYKSDARIQTFDTNGNLTDIQDFGDSDFQDPNEYYNYHIDYKQPGPNITVPWAVTMRTGPTAGAGALMAQRTATFFPQGKPQTVTDVIVQGNDPTTGAARTEASPGKAVWTFTYDPFGNVQTAASPSGTRTTQYTYDTATQTYPTTTAWVDSDPNARYTSTAVYEPKFGLPTRIIDVAGAKQEIDYDSYGRIMSVFAPSDFDANGNRLNPNAPTISVSYSEMPHTGGTGGTAETLPAYAMATHRANLPAEGVGPSGALTATAMRTVNFVDGLTRSIETKKDMTRDDGTGAKTVGMSVSGATTFDARGRVYQRGQPSFASGSGTPTSFVAVAMSNNKTQYAYDVLNRVRQEQHPDNGSQAVTATSYALTFNPSDGRTYIAKTTTDPLYPSNNSYHWRTDLQSVRGETVVHSEPTNVSGVYRVLNTTYGYDVLSRVVTVTDAKAPSGNVTDVSYDSVGHVVAIYNPDAGYHEWRYCVGGYLCAEVSPNANAAGKVIKYSYDRDRLKTVTYPSDPTVTYTYGNATETGATNGYKANRIKQRVNEAGEFDYAYDGLGNVTSETAILKNQMAPGTNYQSYQTQYKWDNFGRLIDVIIPGTTSLGTPSETIRYGYDAGGSVASAIGLAGTNTFTYVSHVGYDEFAAKVRILDGNGVFSTYGYAPDTRRLTNVNTTVQVSGQPARLTQALVYTYDVLGNVKSRTQSQPYDPVATDPVLIAGNSSLSFTYDPLNQLTHADLVSQVKQSERYRASDDLAYDEIGNITSKNQSDLRDAFNSGGTVTGTSNGPNNYINTPSYAGTAFNLSPHAASSISQNVLGTTTTKTLSYDHDGNLMSSLQGTTGRFLTWTDTDRLRSTCNGTASSCSPMTAALYASDGTRTHNKVTIGGTPKETLYVNQYLTVRNGTLPTKHVYIGDTRVASKAETNATTNSTFWYHSDNLQSAQYVTTTGQAVVQHLEYFPGGEIWREDDDMSKLLSQFPHGTAFSGKELDATGYYYLGARYYDPQMQTWLSPDPILPAYVRGEVNSGVFEPKNLGLYSYVWNNPVRLVDPEGQWPKEALGLAIDYLKRQGVANPSTDQIYGVLYQAFPNDPNLQAWASDSHAGQVAKDLFNAVATKTVPGYGELLDALTFFDPNATTDDKVNAAIDMATGGLGAASVAKRREHGSYTNTHASGKVYVGKGSRKRSQESGRERARDNNDPHTATDWTPAATERDAFKDESRRLDAAGGPDSKNNYNEIESPGKKMRQEDGEL
jgi:RHS repeat-associated protein